MPRLSFHFELPDNVCVFAGMYAILERERGVCSMPRGAVLLLLYFCALNKVFRYFPAAIYLAPSSATRQLQLDPKTIGTQQGKRDFIPLSCSNRVSRTMTSRECAYVGHFASCGSASLLSIVVVVSLQLSVCICTYASS
jgi:hypothetical protein